MEWPLTLLRGRLSPPGSRRTPSRPPTPVGRLCAPHRTEGAFWTRDAVCLTRHRTHKADRRCRTGRTRYWLRRALGAVTALSAISALRRGRLVLVLAARAFHACREPGDLRKVTRLAVGTIAFVVTATDWIGLPNLTQEARAYERLPYIRVVGARIAFFERLAQTGSTLRATEAAARARVAGGRVKRLAERAFRAREATLHRARVLVLARSAGDAGIWRASIGRRVVGAGRAGDWVDGRPGAVVPRRAGGLARRGGLVLLRGAAVEPRATASGPDVLVRHVHHLVNDLVIQLAHESVPKLLPLAGLGGVEDLGTCPRPIIDMERVVYAALRVGRCAFILVAGCTCMPFPGVVLPRQVDGAAGPDLGAYHCRQPVRRQ
eukprot:7383965-Prymnesium_polylepis.1